MLLVPGSERKLLGTEFVQSSWLSPTSLSIISFLCLEIYSLAYTLLKYACSWVQLREKKYYPVLTSVNLLKFQVYEGCAAMC